MARTRLMPVEWAKDEVLADCNPLARLLFFYLHQIADRSGRLEDRPKRIGVECLPYDRVDIERLLGDLEAHGLIARYQVDGERYIAIPSFLRHQAPHLREKVSTIPPIPQSLGEEGAEPGPMTTKAGASPAVSVFDPVSVSNPVSVSGSKTVSVSQSGFDERRLVTLAREAIGMTDARAGTDHLLDALRMHAKTKTRMQFTDAQGRHCIEIALDDRRQAFRM